MVRIKPCLLIVVVRSLCLAHQQRREDSAYVAEDVSIPYGTPSLLSPNLVTICAMTSVLYCCSLKVCSHRMRFIALRCGVAVCSKNDATCRTMPHRNASGLNTPIVFRVFR